MNSKKVSINVIGLIWAAVGVGLSIAGFNWILTLGLLPKAFAFILAALIIGFIKNKLILRKVAIKYLKRASLIEFKDNDTFLGWTKILGLKGFIFIGLMMALGVLLRHSQIDRPILGIIYLAVGFSLVYASRIFFVSENLN